MEQDPTSGLNSVLGKIQDSANQLFHFKFLKDIKEAREEIVKANIKTLEEYTGKTREELEKEKPGVCDTYNALVTRLKNPEITLEEIKKISKECWDITH